MSDDNKDLNIGEEASDVGETTETAPVETEAAAVDVAPVEDTAAEPVSETAETVAEPIATEVAPASASVKTEKKPAAAKPQKQPKAAPAKTAPVKTARPAKDAKTPKQSGKQDSKKKNGKNVWQRIVAFFKGIISELKKVTWPKGKTVLTSTGVVLIVVLVFLLVIFGFDSLLSYLLGLLVSGS